MATNRTDTPAMPTVKGATNDVSRGGLFSRANVANPVSGADVNGASVNNGTITITFTEEGTTDTQVVMFDLNQATDGAFDVTLPSGGGSSTPGAGGGDPVISGRIIRDDIVLTRQSGATVPIAIGDLATTAELTAAIDALRMEIPTTLPQLTGFPAYTRHLDELRINATNDGLEFYTPAPPSSAIRAGNVARGVTPTGLTNMPDLEGLVVDADTNLRLRQVATGTYVLEPIPTGPVMRAAMPIQATAPQRARVFDTPIDVVLQYGIDQGTTSEVINDAADIRVTASRTPTGATTPTMLTPTIAMTSPTTFTATIPMAESGEEGTYNVMASVDLTDPTTMMTETINFDPISFNRFLPFFRSGVDLTAANLPPTLGTNVDESTAEWDNRVVALPNRPTGRMYWAAPASVFGSGFTLAAIQELNGTPAGARIRVGFLRAVTLMTDDGESFVYNVYTGSVRDGFQLASFT